MEEEALQPGGSEETLLERLFSYYGPTEGEVKGQHHLLAHTLTISSTVPPESLTDTGIVYACFFDSMLPPPPPSSRS